jgi:hypothetical protein
MVGEFTLQDQLGELQQQPVRADQADPPLAGLGDQLLVDRVGLRSKPGPGAAGPASSFSSYGVSYGVPSALSVMELHRCIYSPSPRSVSASSPNENARQQHGRYGRAAWDMWVTSGHLPRYAYCECEVTAGMAGPFCG